MVRDVEGQAAGLPTMIFVALASCLAMLQASLLMNSVGKASNSFVRGRNRLGRGASLTGQTFFGRSAPRSRNGDARALSALGIARLESRFQATPSWPKRKLEPRVELSVEIAPSRRAAANNVLTCLKSGCSLSVRQKLFATTATARRGGAASAAGRGPNFSPERARGRKA